MVLEPGDRLLRVGPQLGVGPGQRGHAEHAAGDHAHRDDAERGPRSGAARRPSRGRPRRRAMPGRMTRLATATLRDDMRARPVKTTSGSATRHERRRARRAAASEHLAHEEERPHAVEPGGCHSSIPRNWLALAEHLEREQQEPRARAG